MIVPHTELVDDVHSLRYCIFYHTESRCYMSMTVRPVKRKRICKFIFRRLRIDVDNSEEDPMYSIGTILVRKLNQKKTKWNLKAHDKVWRDIISRRIDRWISEH
jgi:hypothetical protein